MATQTVTDDIINSRQAEIYFTRADRRVMIGLRATLEMLGIPVPEYARRRQPGPTPAKSVLAAFTADNPEPRCTTLAPRKPNAAPAIVAAAKASRAEQLSTPDNLFGQVFSGR